MSSNVEQIKVKKAELENVMRRLSSNINMYDHEKPIYARLCELKYKLIAELIELKVTANEIQLITKDYIYKKNEDMSNMPPTNTKYLKYKMKYLQLKNTI
jgi:hypothetical protein